MSARRGLVFPMVLVAVGVLALLTNTGLVPAAGIARLVDMWPLVLIVLGIEMVLRGTTGPVAAGRLGMVAVVVACAGALVYASVGASIPVGERTVTFSDTFQELRQADLEMDFGGADVQVRYGDPGDMGNTLYDAHLTFAGRNRPTAHFDHSSGTVNIALGDPGNFRFGPGPRRIADVTLNPKVFWSVHLSGGATHAVINLARGTVRGVEVSGGASNVEITLPPPHGATTIAVSGGANSVRVHRPGAARAEVSGGAGSLRFDGRSLGGLGDLSAETQDYSSATDRYLVTVSGGANNVTVDGSG